MSLYSDLNEILTPCAQRIKGLESQVDEVNESLNAEIEYLERLNYDTRFAESSNFIQGYFDSNSGANTSGNYAYYRATPMIPLQDLLITIVGNIDSGLMMVITLYDENGDFVRIMRNNTALTTATYTATSNWMTAFGQYPATHIRFNFFRYPYADITSQIEITPLNDNTNIAKKAVATENATLQPMSITLDKTAFVAGYLNNTGGIATSTEYKVSPYIEVTDCMELTITKLATAGWHIIACYDENQTFTEIVDYKAKITTTLESVDVLVPHGTKYIRYAVANGMINATTCAYKMQDIPKHYLAPSLIELWDEQTFGKMNNLFKTATNRALITIIDDDTKNSEMVTMFHDACEAQGIKGGYAVITSRWTLDDTLKNTLLGFESEGYGMCAHCYIQDSKWNNPLNNMSQCEADMINCIRDMQNAGFINFRHWLTPGGHVETAMQELAKRLGMVCAVSSGLSSIETTEAKYGRYAIRRCSLEASDRTGALTINDFKALIDEAVSCNGWLLITTHFGNGEWDANAIADRFDVVVDYAQSKYMKFCTLQEAWAIRRPIYEFYEKL